MRTGSNAGLPLFAGWISARMRSIGLQLDDLVGLLQPAILAMRFLT